MEVKNKSSLEESLIKNFEGTEISDFMCEGCNKKVDIQKRSLLTKPPNVLIFHLQRIVFNFNTFGNEKINTFFEFPQILDLSSHSFKTIMTQEGKSEQDIEE